MAELFNNYFTSVFTHEDLSSIPVLQTDDQSPLIGSLHITPETVFNKLVKLKSGKSPGPDGWPTQLIKQMAEYICVPLSILFNKSLDSGVLPEEWKSAHVTLVHKKGARNLVTNY